MLWDLLHPQQSGWGVNLSGFLHDFMYEIAFDTPDVVGTYLASERFKRTGFTTTNGLLRFIEVNVLYNLGLFAKCGHHFSAPPRHSKARRRHLALLKKCRAFPPALVLQPMTFDVLGLAICHRKKKTLGEKNRS